MRGAGRFASASGRRRPLYKAGAKGEPDVTVLAEADVLSVLYLLIGVVMVLIFLGFAVKIARTAITGKAPAGLRKHDQPSEEDIE